MARNEEKKLSMLNRFLEVKAAEKSKSKDLRPFLASECNNLQDAEKWRLQVLREISRKVMEIQNAGLGEHRIRDLNDEINKLLREKGHWEKQILILGGPDYAQTAPKIIDTEGQEIRGSSGYKYFGAAKNLPGVRELLEPPKAEKAKRTRGELYRRIDADYYGFRDDDDGLLVLVEAEQEGKLAEEAVHEWREQRRQLKRQGGMPGEDENEADDQNEGSGTIEEQEERGASDEPLFVAHVSVPSQEEIERVVLERRKKALLEKYASDELRQEQERTAALLPARP